ncbi:MAG: hypothetical protein QOJ57_418 [Thermoleophilaceae bacterium]|nr:hypothetical protein [Thermoleophilaceae bacterium]
MLECGRPRLELGDQGVRERKGSSNEIRLQLVGDSLDDAVEPGERYRVPSVVGQRLQHLAAPQAYCASGGPRGLPPLSSHLIAGGADISSGAGRPAGVGTVWLVTGASVTA